MMKKMIKYIQEIKLYHSLYHSSRESLLIISSKIYKSSKNSLIMSINSQDQFSDPILLSQILLIIFSPVIKSAIQMNMNK